MVGQAYKGREGYMKKRESKNGNWSCKRGKERSKGKERRDRGKAGLPTVTHFM